MIERTPEFAKAERSALKLCLIPFFIFGAVLPGLFSFFFHDTAETALMFTGVAISFLLVNPLILKVKIRKFPRFYWRYYYAVFGSLFGIVLFVGGAIYWASVG